MTRANRQFVKMVARVDWTTLAVNASTALQRAYSPSYLRDVWNGFHVSKTLLDYLESSIGDKAPARRLFSGIKHRRTTAQKIRESGKEVAPCHNTPH